MELEQEKKNKPKGRPPRSTTGLLNKLDQKAKEALREHKEKFTNRYGEILGKDFSQKHLLNFAVGLLKEGHYEAIFQGIEKTRDQELKELQLNEFANASPEKFKELQIEALKLLAEKQRQTINQ